MAARVDDQLRHAILQAPGQQFRVIVRTESDPATLAEQCKLEGMEIHHQYRLVPGLALTGRGEALLMLADNPQVTNIELDQEVSI